MHLGKLSVIGLLAAVAAASASACENCKKGYVFGAPIVLGNGMAFTWAKMGEDKKPKAVGVTITETALQGLPEEIEGPMPVMQYVLELPKEIKGQPFDHVLLDWAPKGHEPAGIYDKAHFDVHFYMMKSADRLKITAEGKDKERCSKAPKAEFMPAGYIFAPASELPQMGGHWADLSSPELNGQPFTSTMIFGTYDGKVTFIEPMVAASFLSSKPDFEAVIKQPQRYSYSGYYPAKYRVFHNTERREISVSLEDLAFHQASK